MVNPIGISGSACIVKEGAWWQNQGELLKKDGKQPVYKKTNTKIYK
jgi:hypothetical protein